MSLLALLAASAGAPPVEPPDPLDPPYPFPTSAPYNVPVAAPTPTPDGSGQAVHPSVVDFATQHDLPTWNGHRYWMAMTPYPYGNASNENPCILVSEDCYTWTVPAGQVNPIDPAPGSSGYNSDTDLVYDPETGRLWCFWREHNHSDTARTIGEHLHVAWSTNGTAWTKQESVLITPGGSAGMVSPCAVKYAPGQWRLLTIPGKWWSATTPVGPWTLIGPSSFTWVGGGAATPWHFGLTHHDGVYYGLADYNEPQESVYAATSTDGQTWTVSQTPIIARDLGWDRRPYRSCLTLHEDGERFRVWYSASDTATPPAPWRIGYTQVPLTEWPDIDTE